jgi:hypothetical protein
VIPWFTVCRQTRQFAAADAELGGLLAPFGLLCKQPTVVPVVGNLETHVMGPYTLYIMPETVAVGGQGSAENAAQYEAQCAEYGLVPVSCNDDGGQFSNRNLDLDGTGIACCFSDAFNANNVYAQNNRAVAFCDDAPRMYSGPGECCSEGSTHQYVCAKPADQAAAGGGH